MILGMSISTFTLVHVVLSLAGIFSGTVVLFGMLSANRLNGWTALFLVTTVLTSVTGFFFDRDHLLPSHVVGIISLVVMAVAILALYVYRLARSWRWIYVAGAAPLVEAAVSSGLSVVSFGQSIDGEVYVVSLGGTLHKVVPVP
ncbi:MAG TPA: hypothetical protein VEI74_05320 [Candidatus Methylomirabilis sp.]|nr:hypothetical protein [Candidatus Methylomirabilis sp.]